VFPDADLASVSDAAVIRQHAPHVSKKDIFCIFANLQKNKLSPLNLIVEVVNESCPEHNHYHQKMYNNNNKHKLENTLDMIMDDVRGRIVLLEWMRPHTLQQVHDTIYNKMDALTLESHTMTNTITPKYLMSWSLKANVEDIVDPNTPCLLGLINIASQTQNSLEKSKKKSTTAVSQTTKLNFYITNNGNIARENHICSNAKSELHISN
jgi:hypothetical protein